MCIAALNDNEPDRLPYTDRSQLIIWQHEYLSCRQELNSDLSLSFFRGHMKCLGNGRLEITGQFQRQTDAFFVSCSRHKSPTMTSRTATYSRATSNSVIVRQRCSRAISPWSNSITRNSTELTRRQSTTTVEKHAVCFYSAARNGRRFRRWQ